ncbi:hypothetical protein LXL04_003105 [Taraxacum kok-saghyz]
MYCSFTCFTKPSNGVESHHHATNGIKAITMQLVQLVQMAFNSTLSKLISISDICASIGPPPIREERKKQRSESPNQKDRTQITPEAVTESEEAEERERERELGSFENSYIPENPRTPPISYISQTVIPFKKPTSGPSKTFIIIIVR